MHDVVSIQLFQEKLLVIKSLSKVVFCLLLLAPAMISAAEPAAGAPLKIAVINIQQAIGESDKAKAAAAELKAKYKKDIDELDAINTSMQAIQAKVKKDREILAAAELARLEGEFREKGERSQSILRILQTAQQEMEQKLGQEIEPKVRKALADVVTAGGYDLVLNASALVGRAPPAIDITRKVTEKLNAGG